MTVSRFKLDVRMLRELLREPYLETIKEPGFWNYHCIGMHVMSLLRTPALSIKLYFFNEQHPTFSAESPVNDDGYIVNPHDHRYPFQQWVLKGAMTNFIFKQHTSENAHGLRGPSWSMREFNPVTKEWSAVLRAGIRMEVEAHPLMQGDSYWLDTDQIHTLGRVEPGTILLTFQYAADASRSVTYLPTGEPLPFQSGPAGLRGGDALMYYIPLPPSDRKRLAERARRAVQQLIWYGHDRR